MISTKAKSERINVILPKTTIKLLAKHSAKGERSQLIDLALRKYLANEYRTKLTQDLISGYRQNRVSSLNIAKEWQPLEEELWARESR